MNDDLLPVGAAVGRYTIEGLLGQGGMAAVYKVRHQQLNTLHALKMLTVPGRRIRQRLVQEGRVQAALRHPNIVSVIDIIEHENQPGLVMEYVDGPTLEQLLAARELQWHEIDHLGRGILRGVQAAHDQGLIHRDLKPANVLIAVHDDELVPKVTDFGLAKLQRGQSSGHTRSGDTMGTPAYMAPEAIKNAKNVDHRADVFSLGAVLYELVTGSRCFKGNDILETFTAVVNADHEPVRDLFPDVPERMERAIEQALDPDPERRLQTVRELLDTWTDLASIDPGTTLTPQYTPGLIDRVRSMGQGRDSLSKVLSEQETIPISASSAPAPRLVSLDTIPDTTETYFPTPEPAEPAEAAQDTVLLVNDPVVAEQQARLEPAPPSRAPWLGLGAGALGVAALALVALLALGGAALLVGAPPTAPTRPVEPALPPQPVAPPTPQIPELEEPPEPPPVPVEVPAPALGAPTPPLPRPEPSPAPTPVAPQAPEPAPEAAPAADMARVEVSGGVRVLLRRDGGGAHDPGPVPPGTYTVAAWFDDDEPTTVRTGVVLAAGDTLQLRCVKEMHTCR